MNELKERNDSLSKQNQAQRLEIQRPARQVRELKLEQSEIAALRSRLDRLEKASPQTRRTGSFKVPKGKPLGKSEIARI